MRGATEERTASAPSERPVVPKYEGDASGLKATLGIIATLFFAMTPAWIFQLVDMIQKLLGMKG